MTLPLEKMMAEGQMLRIQPQAGRTIKVTGSNPGDQPCAFVGIGFKDGKPTSNWKYNRMNLDSGQSVTMTFSDSPAGADTIVLRATIGTVKFVVAFAE